MPEWHTILEQLEIPDGAVAAPLCIMGPTLTTSKSCTKNSRRSLHHQASVLRRQSSLTMVGAQRSLLTNCIVAQKFCSRYPQLSLQ
ncbi:hypothetical protein WJX82_006388 [Trebouxia sp. C0006]